MNIIRLRHRVRHRVRDSVSLVTGSGYLYNHDQQPYPNQHNQPNLAGHDHRIPLTPEDYLFTSQLSAPIIPSALQNLKREEKVSLTDLEYKQAIKAKPQGLITRLSYKDTLINLTGTQYDTLPQKNLFKILNHHRPQAILVSIRPDTLFSQFNCFPVNPKTNVFSNRYYFRQLKREADEVMPSQSHKRALFDDLREVSMMVSGLENRRVYKKYIPYERVDDKALAVISYYGQLHKLPVILAGLPEYIYRQHIVNRSSLMQLQELFKQCAQQLPFQPDLKRHSLLGIAQELSPGEWVQPDDVYMRSVIEYMVHKSEYKRLDVFTGMGQSQGVHALMERQKIKGMDYMLVPPKIKGSIIRDVSNVELIEKHAILDVITFAKLSQKEMSLEQKFNRMHAKYTSNEFRTTGKIIKQYGDPFNLDSSTDSKLKTFHYQMWTKYIKIFKTEYEKGQDNLQNAFLKKARNM